MTRYYSPHIEPPFISNGRINLAGGVLSGSLTCAGDLYWTGGFLGEASPLTLTIATSGTLFIEANGPISGNVINEGRIVWEDSPDTVNVRGEGIASGLVNLGQLIISGTKSRSWTRGQHSGFSITNNGVIRMQNNQTAHFYVPFHQDTNAHVIVEKGRLQLMSGGDLEGNIQAGQGAEVRYQAGTFTISPDYHPSGLGFIGVHLSGTPSLRGELATNLACYSCQPYFDHLVIRPTGELSFGSDCVFSGVLDNQGRLIWGDGNVRSDGVGSRLVNHGEWIMTGHQVWTRGQDSDFQVVNHGLMRNDFNPSLAQSAESTLDVPVDNRGTIEVQTGVLRFGGGVFRPNDGRLAVRLNNPTNYGRIEFGEQQEFAGSLLITLAPGFIPSAGSTFTVLMAKQVSGAFEAYSGLTIKDDLKFTPVFGRDSIALRTDGMVVMSEPDLSIVSTGSMVLLWWPERFPEYQLLACTNLLTPEWVPVLLSGTNQAVVSSASLQRFFKTVK